MTTRSAHIIRYLILATSLVTASTALAGPTAHFGRELTKGVAEGVKQKADTDKLDVRKISREAGRGMAEGFFGELRSQLSSVCGDKPNAECLDGIARRYAYETARATARGAAAGAPPWPSLLLGGAGFVAGLLFSAIVALLFGQRRLRRELTAFKPRTA